MKKSSNRQSVGSTIFKIGKKKRLPRRCAPRNDMGKISHLSLRPQCAHWAWQSRIGLYAVGRSCTRRVRDAARYSFEESHLDYHVAALLAMTNKGLPHPCHCEERSDVAILCRHYCFEPAGSLLLSTALRMLHFRASSVLEYRKSLDASESQGFSVDRIAKRCGL